MSRFDVAREPRLGERKTVNEAGGEAFTRTPKAELAVLVLGSTLQGGFYESADDQLDRLRHLTKTLAESGDLLFAAKAACYARKVHGLRSITHALAGEIAHLRPAFADQSTGWGARFFDKVVNRPDDMCEILSYHISRTHHGKRRAISHSLQRGFQRAFLRFDEYQLAKWKGSRRSMSLRDAAHLVRPAGAKGSLIYRLRAGELKSSNTFESKLSKAGQTKNAEKAKEEAWGDLLKRGKLGYFAGIRNIRNIAEQAPECLTLLRYLLVNEGSCRNSRVFPHQLFKAYDEIAKLNGPHARTAMEIIVDVINLAGDNCPEFDGDTLVCVDDSGSMGSTWSLSTPPIISACIFAASIIRKNKSADLMMFSGSANYLNVDVRGSVTDVANRIKSKFRGSGTNFHAPFQTANRPYDRMFFLSDEQGWQGYRTPTDSLRSYEQRHRIKPYIYSWNLAVTGTSMFPERRIATISGISVEVFDIVKNAERDPKALVNTIEEYKI